MPIHYGRGREVLAVDLSIQQVAAAFDANHRC